MFGENQATTKWWSASSRPWSPFPGRYLRTMLFPVTQWFLWTGSSLLVPGGWATWVRFARLVTVQSTEIRMGNLSLYKSISGGNPQLSMSMWAEPRVVVEAVLLLLVAIVLVAAAAVVELSVCIVMYNITTRINILANIDSNCQLLSNQSISNKHQHRQPPLMPVDSHPPGSRWWGYRSMAASSELSWLAVK